MKIKHLLWLLLVCVMACQPAHQQKAVSAKDTLQQQDTAVAAMAPEEIEQSLAWDSLNTRFISDCLNPFLAARHIQPNCSGCDRFQFSYCIRVDGRGHITEAKQLSRSVTCTALEPKESAALDAYIQAYFKGLKLPLVLHNGTFEKPFGFLLRC